MTDKQQEGKKTVNGVKVVSKWITRDGKYWTWHIKIADGRDYIGGNYLSRDQAVEGLVRAFDLDGEDR